LRNVAYLFWNKTQYLVLSKKEKKTVEKPVMEKKVFTLKY